MQNAPNITTILYIFIWRFSQNITKNKKNAFKHSIVKKTSYNPSQPQEITVI